MKTRLLGTLLFLLWLPAYTQAGTILIMGDSLSVALGVEIEKGWVGLLKGKLESEPALNHWQVINASISGDTTKRGLNRLPLQLNKHQPNLCVLALGANDGLQGRSIKTMRSNLVSMIEQCQAIDAEVVLLGIRLPPNYGPLYTQAFEAVYPELAEQYQLELVPFFLDGVAGNDQLMQPDRLHPNTNAQPKILANVWPTLKKFLVQDIEIKETQSASAQP